MRLITREYGTTSTNSCNPTREHYYMRSHVVCLLHEMNLSHSLYIYKVVKTIVKPRKLTVQAHTKY